MSVKRERKCRCFRALPLVVYEKEAVSGEDAGDPAHALNGNPEQKKAPRPLKRLWNPCPFQ